MKLTDDQKYSLYAALDNCKYVPLSVAAGRWINDYLHCSLSLSDIESLHATINSNNYITEYDSVVHWIESMINCLYIKVVDYQDRLCVIDGTFEKIKEISKLNDMNIKVNGKDICYTQLMFNDMLKLYRLNTSELYMQMVENELAKLLELEK